MKFIEVTYFRHPRATFLVNFDFVDTISSSKEGGCMLTLGGVGEGSVHVAEEYGLFVDELLGGDESS